MKRVRDFHSQAWNNPFFGRSARPAGFRGRLKQTLGLALFSLVSGGIVYAFVYSPLLRLEKVDIKGNKVSDPVRLGAIATQAVAGYDYLFIPRDHLFYARKETIANMLLLNFPVIRGVRVKKGFDTIKISIEEKEPTYRVIVGEKSYLLDQDGGGLREAAGAEGDRLIAISLPTLNFAPNVTLIPPGLLTEISNLHKYFATQVGVRDKLFRLDRTNGKIEVETTEGWYAIIDPAMNTGSQLETLSAALFGKFKPDERRRLEYVDVRYGDKVFYKWK